MKKGSICSYKVIQVKNRRKLISNDPFIKTLLRPDIIGFLPRFESVFGLKGI